MHRAVGLWFQITQRLPTRTHRSRPRSTALGRNTHENNVRSKPHHCYFEELFHFHEDSWLFMRLNMLHRFNVTTKQNTVGWKYTNTITDCNASKSLLHIHRNLDHHLPIRLPPTQVTLKSSSLTRQTNTEFHWKLKLITIFGPSSLPFFLFLAGCPPSPPLGFTFLKHLYLAQFQPKSSPQNASYFRWSCSFVTS
jgi:hypothetical protein